MNKLATIISQIRGDRTQVELAKATGISETAISRYESGQRRPGYDAIATLLQVAKPEQQRDLLEALGIEDVNQFATALLASASVVIVDNTPTGIQITDDRQFSQEAS